MRQPWVKWYTRDWLDHKELRRCSRAARGVWADLCCLMAEGTPMGYLTDKVGPLDSEFLANRTATPLRELERLMEELLEKKVMLQDEEGTYFSKKMVEDEDLRQRRAAGGVESQGNPNVPRSKDIHNGYPLHTNNGVGVKDPPIVSSSDSTSEKTKKTSFSEAVRADWFTVEFWPVVWQKIGGKNRTKKSWLAKVHTVELKDVIIAAAVLQGPEIIARAQRSGGTVLHPATWLNQERWEDESAPSASAAPIQPKLYESKIAEWTKGLEGDE